MHSAAQFKHKKGKSKDLKLPLCAGLGKEPNHKSLLDAALPCISTWKQSPTKMQGNSDI